MALLVYLAVESRRGPVSRDRLLGLFWPESEEARARNTLSQALHHLRQALGAEVLESHGASAVSVRPETLWCDATAFLDALERGEVELALDLYRGEFCSNVFASGTPEVELWLEAQRTRIRRQALEAARRTAVGLADRDDLAGAAQAARRALALEPDDEGDVRSLLSLIDRAGDSAGALHAYQQYARRLAATLETEPSPETRRLAEAIRHRAKTPPAVESPGPQARAPESPQTEPDPAEAPAPASLSLTSASPPPPHPPPPRRPQRSAAITAAALSVLALVGAVTVVGRDHGGTTRSRRTLAVVPFTLRAGSRLAYLHDGMVDLLSAKLGDVPGVQVIDPRTVIAATAALVHDSASDAAVGAQVARRVGADWYISGAVIDVGGRLQLDGALHDPSRGPEPLVTASVVGDTAALFELVDQLTGRMLADMLIGRDTALTRLAAVTTHSLPALKAFLEGERSLRAGQEAQAAAAFRTAVDLDSGFALAQYRLALSATWVPVPDARDPTAVAALAARHADRLTPLGRDLVKAYGAYRDMRTEEAERGYRDVTAAHPDNVEAWLMLGETRFHYNPWLGRSPMEAWPAFERVLTLDPGNLHAMIHLARLAAAEGRSADLDALTRRYAAGSPDATRMLEMRALQVFAGDHPAERAAVTAAARDADDFVLTSLLQAALVYAQNLDAARELAPVFLQSVTLPQARLVGRRMITMAGLAGGQWDRDRLARWVGSEVDGDWLLESEALVASDPFFPMARSRVTALRDSVLARRPYPDLPKLPGIDLGPLMQSYLVGLLSVRLGDTAAVNRALAALHATHDTDRATPAGQLAHALRAEIARSRGDSRGALAELERFPVELSEVGPRRLASWGVRERFLRAELLHALGRDQESLPWYNSLQSSYDLGFMAAAHLRQAQVHQRLGQAEAARFHYDRFLSLWRDCDPEFRPLVARARAARASLMAGG